MPNTFHGMSARSVTRLALSLLACLLLVVVGGCATGGPVSHGFDFQPFTDSPEIKVLNWSYGTLRPAKWEVDLAADSERGLAGRKIFGPMTVGDQIQIEWVSPGSKKRTSQSINLVGLLPRSMAERRVHLRFEDGVPKVYLITPDRRAPAYMPWKNKLLSFERIELVFPSSSEVSR